MKIVGLITSKHTIFVHGITHIWKNAREVGVTLRMGDGPDIILYRGENTDKFKEILEIRIAAAFTGDLMWIDCCAIGDEVDGKQKDTDSV